MRRDSANSEGLVSALTQKTMNFLFVKGMDSVALYAKERNRPQFIFSGS